MKTSNGFFAALFVLVCLCSAGRATSVSLDALSNTSNTGYVSWNTQGKPETEDVYISQFQMTYKPTVGSASALFTYCVDLNHSEQWSTAYNVTPVSLTSAFGQTNGSEIGYLYRTYGAVNLAGQATQDEALQLALWDLTVRSSRTPTSFSVSVTPGTYTSGDSLFAVSGISSDVAALTNTYLQDAKGKSGGNVYLLQSGPASDSSVQQSVLAINPNPADDLAPAPEPTAFILCATLLGAWGLFGSGKSRLAALGAV
jgi:hypothetical protein